jgi:small subunit ribosomal protein S17|uniref:Small ribosomal subunit protein uS17 n=1 Tax=Thermodesulfobacterium geofontis TaxID=1295609 RepID=A0A7V5K1N3_9BACT
MGKRKQFIGTVVSDKMDKTVVVMVETLVKHPLYGKYVKRRKKYMAHDENNECKVGDKVLIEETRPLSRRKRWRVRQILEKGKVVEVEEVFEEGGEV